MIAVKKKKWLQRLLPLAGLLAAVLWYGFASGAFCVPDDNGTVIFSFLDVGQGDAILIRSPAGALLVDTGPDNAEDALQDNLAAKGIDTLKMLFLSHGDSDHAGNADRVIQTLNVDLLLLPQSNTVSGSTRAALRAAEDRGTNISRLCAGDVLYSGDLCLTVLSPFSPPRGEENTDSLVLRVTYGDTAVLLTGDADTEAELRILEKTPDLVRCDVLKLGHHGSRTSTSEALLAAAAPQFAVISCGKANSFGHPHSETLLRLQTAGIPVLRTDELGEITFQSDGKTVTRVQ